MKLRERNRDDTMPYSTVAAAISLSFDQLILLMR